MYHKKGIWERVLEVVRKGGDPELVKEFEVLVDKVQDLLEEEESRETLERVNWELLEKVKSILVEVEGEEALYNKDTCQSYIYEKVYEGTSISSILEEFCGGGKDCKGCTIYGGLSRLVE